MTKRPDQNVGDLEGRLGHARGQAFRGVRRRSEMTILGIPAYDVAIGGDPETGEVRGHARGFLAIGDIATGVFALGGLARGVFALGGVALGLVSFGGLSIGALLAIGGLAIGSVALGGGAVGRVAVGGGAVGYYACGGGAAGKHVVDATRRDPEAVEFFRSWQGPECPGLRPLR
jgi:hypothetical protein